MVKRLGNKLILILLASLSLFSCGKVTEPREKAPSSSEETLVDEIHFMWDKVRTVSGTSITIPVKRIVFDDGMISKDPALLKWSVSDESIATVSNNGTLSAKKTGCVNVCAQSNGVSAIIPVYITDGSSTTGVGQFETSNMFDTGSALKTNSYPQGFDLTADGYLYYLQVASPDVHRIYINKIQPSTVRTDDSAVLEWMALDYFGHGTNYTLEEKSSGELYVWVATYGTITEDDTYWHEQVIGRFKYKAGAVLQPEDAEDYFYIGPSKDIHVAVDVEGDDLMIYYADSDESKPRHFVVYSLKEAMKTPVKSIWLDNRTFGGATSAESQLTDAPIVKVHDLRAITKKAEFGFAGQKQAQAYVDAGGSSDDESALSYYSYQGFEINDGAIYFYEGEQDGGFNSKAYLTVFNYAGQIIEKRTKVNIADNAGALVSNGITATGNMEAEGLKVRNGVLYIGFGSNDTDNIRRGNVFKYDIAKLQ